MPVAAIRSLLNMNCRYLATDKATDWETDSFAIRVLKRILKGLNPNYAYETKFPIVRKWVIEIEDDNFPSREIGLDEHDIPVIWGPSDEVYGFWLDTNMAYDDFNGDPISRDYFEKHWDWATHLE